MNKLFERLKQYLSLKTTTKQSVGAYMDGYADGWEDGMKLSIEILEEGIEEKVNEPQERPEEVEAPAVDPWALCAALKDKATYVLHFLESDTTIKMVSVGDFMIGKFPITQRQWQVIMESNLSRFKGCDDCPVENVSWHDAQEFIEKLNETAAAKEVYSTFGRKFRLPTEAEWEFAAKGGYKSKGYEYSGSNNIDEVAWYSGNSEERTHPVGEKVPNELGLYDMSGNVWEWCEDLVKKDSHNRVIRGGGWNYAPLLCRAASRDNWPPTYRYYNVGFRLAL